MTDPAVRTRVLAAFGVTEADMQAIDAVEGPARRAAEREREAFIDRLHELAEQTSRELTEQLVAEGRL